MAAGEKNRKSRVRKIMKKGKRGNASFWTINSLPPARRNLFIVEKIISKEGGGPGNDRNAQYISLYYWLRG